jgi:hypothetical protein
MIPTWLGISILILLAAILAVTIRSATKTGTKYTPFDARRAMIVCESLCVDSKVLSNTEIRVLSDLYKKVPDDLRVVMGEGGEPYLFREPPADEDDVYLVWSIQVCRRELGCERNAEFYSGKRWEDE